ncbi:MAG: PHP-associated domain-containing protein [Candidatus Odinarchaeota archaeon]
MLIDLHIHTNTGSFDSNLTLNSIAKHVNPRIEAVVVTDHDFLPKKMEPREIRGILVLFGAEITTQQGHLLAYGIEELPSKNLDVKEVVMQVHKQGGVCVAAHPFRAYHALGEAVYDSDLLLDGLEINGSSSKSSNNQARKVARIKELPLTGGSDAHVIRNLNTTTTKTREPVMSMDDLVRQIKKKTITPSFIQSK